jgi:cobalt/nickel transport system permease protein
MGADHQSSLHLPGDSPVHRMAPEVKIVAAFGTVLCVVATPREIFWAFGVYLALVSVLALVAAIPARWMLSRLMIELPFVVLAFLLPFTVGGERVAGLSVEGLLSGWNILAKGTLGLGLSLVLAATTAPNDLVRGLQRLRMPTLVTTIMSLMLRYAEVVVAEAKRMRLARIARGHDPRFAWQAAATTRGVASLFVRSYERGERVHLAMVSRGWDGAMPSFGRAGNRAAWLPGLLPVVAAVTVLGVALWTA